MNHQSQQEEVQTSIKVILTELRKLEEFRILGGQARSQQESKHKLMLHRITAASARLDQALDLKILEMFNSHPEILHFIKDNKRHKTKSMAKA